MKKLSDLKGAVCGFMSRSAQAFVTNGQDTLLLAINHAKDYCQRAIDFEVQKCSAKVAIPSTFVANITQATDMSGVAIQLKGIKRGFYMDTGGYFRPVRMIGKEAWNQLQLRNQEEYFPAQSSFSPRIVMNGGEFFITPNMTQAMKVPWTIAFDGVSWIADFLSDDDTNFLLTFCSDFLLFRTIFELNFFLKEDQRVPVSEKLLTDVWNNIVQWNATVIGNSLDDVSLD